MSHLEEQILLELLEDNVFMEIHFLRPWKVA